MTDHRPLDRRQFLRASTAVVLATPLAGCFGGDGSPSSNGTDADGTPTDGSSAEPSTSDRLGEQPYPAALVGTDAYVDELEAFVATARFPDPDPTLIPELTKARFVATAARDEGEESFANSVAAVRDPVFEPLERYDAVVILASEPRREELDDDELDELRERAGLTDENLTVADDPEQVLESVLSDREKTFFDYPGTPLHVIEAAESEGLDQLDASPEDRAADVAEAHRPYVRQRTRIEAVVAGARDLATTAYEEGLDPLLEQTPSDRTYDSKENYAAVVAFNASLAAEQMLETDGELVTPP